ncbi:MAG: AAA family ATPase [marine benthic group bacterium]|nr:AAA family ATPase [Gemmatimonadota bacterium]
MIEIRTLGPVQVLVDGGEPPRELLWRKNLALLLYLSRSKGGRRSREHLVGMLWGDRPDATARHSLNEALRVLRRACSDGALESVGDQVVLDVDSVQLDLERLEPLVEAGEWSQASALVRGSWMEGFAVPGCDEVEDWLAAERSHWNRIARTVLLEEGALRLSRGDEIAARELAGRALGLDPFSDGAIRLLMESAVIRGERASALGIYQEFAARLTAELGIEPEIETAALAERVERERSFRAPEQLPREEAWSRRPPLIGRERELETALAVIRGSASNREPALVVVHGESGSGKTRLADEVVTRTRLEGAAIARIRSVPSDAGAEWSALLGLARGGLLDAEGAAIADPRAVAALLDRTGWQDPALREYASGVAPLAFPGAFTEVARAVAELRPLVLWIDEADYVDASSLRALPGLVRDLAGTPTTLLMTMRGYPPSPGMDELRGRVGHDIAGVSIALPPLDLPRMQGLVEVMMPDLGSTESERLARRILVDSAGLPLFAVDLLNGVRLGLELEKQESWPEPFRTMDQAYPGDLPDTVTAAIRIGFRRLSEPAQEVLAAAAVLESPVSSKTLARAIGIEDAPLSEALDELEWHRWLSADARGYSFVARIVRDVIERDMLTSGQRIRIRETAGE